MPFRAAAPSVLSTSLPIRKFPGASTASVTKTCKNSWRQKIDVVSTLTFSTSRALRRSCGRSPYYRARDRSGLGPPHCRRNRKW